MISFVSSLYLWLKDHRSAILGTIVALQNSHPIGVGFGKALLVLQGLFSVLGGT